MDKVEGEIKIKDFLHKFMTTRYGIDELNKFLIKLYVFILIIKLFFKISFIDYILWLVVFLFLFRFLSKNKFDRLKENRLYLNIKNGKFKFKNANKQYIYKKCKKCEKTLKLPLPKKRGIKSVICPNCKRKMKVLVFRKRG